MVSFRYVMRVIFVLSLLAPFVCPYEPTWPSLDSRPLPAWYDEAKLGIFIHWGVFSVPSFGNEWFWKYWHDGHSAYTHFMKENYPPNWTYADFARYFTAEFYDPGKWAKIFEASGAKYIVLTSKHHEGFTLWPSKYSFNWNAGAVGPKRDLVGDLAAAVRNKTSLRFGLYHSLFEWFNPIFDRDRDNNFTTNEFVRFKTMPELYEIVNTYKPEVIWSDGDAHVSDNYWRSKEFIAWLYNESPVKDTVVTNDRWGASIPCHHGDFYTCRDRYHPGKLIAHKWESCNTLDKHSWGFRRDASLQDYLTPEDVLKNLVTTVAYGGNLLLNVGPTHDGRIPTIMEERLSQLGKWMKINGEAIYATKPWKHQNDTVSKSTWYTSNAKKDVVYAITLTWPADSKLLLGSVSPTKNTFVLMLGHNDQLKWRLDEHKQLEITFPHMSQVKSKWAWTVVLGYVTPK